MYNAEFARHAAIIQAFGASAVVGDTAIIDGKEVPISKLAKTKLASAMLDIARPQIAAEIEAAVNAARDRITGGASAADMASWSTKASQARAIKAGTLTATDCPMLAAEAEQTGSTVPALADLILTRAASYEAAAGTLTGISRRRWSEATTAASIDDALAARDAALSDIAALISTTA